MFTKSGITVKAWLSTATLVAMSSGMAWAGSDIQQFDWNGGDMVAQFRQTLQESSPVAARYFDPSAKNRPQPQFNAAGGKGDKLKPVWDNYYDRGDDYRHDRRHRREHDRQHDREDYRHDRWHDNNDWWGWLDPRGDRRRHDRHHDREDDRHDDFHDDQRDHRYPEDHDYSRRRRYGGW